MKVPARHIQLQGFRGDLHGPLQHVQLRPDAEHGKRISTGAQLVGQRGIALARGVAHAHHQTPRSSPAHGVDQLTAQDAQRGGMHQHHALACEPDAAIGRRKMHLAAQVGIRRQSRKMGHGKILSIKEPSPEEGKRAQIHHFVTLASIAMHEMMMLHSNIGAGFPGGALSSWHRVAMRF